MTIQRDGGGKLPAYAWPGGYPIIYVMGDGEVLCPACANGENGSEAYEPKDANPNHDRQWTIAEQVIHYEGEPETCAHCNATIPSAYGAETK